MAVLLSHPALDLGLSSAAITCVWIHQDFSLFGVTLLPHARLFPGLGLGWSIWLGHWTFRVWNEVEGKEGLSEADQWAPIKGDVELSPPPPHSSSPLGGGRYVSMSGNLSRGTMKTSQ